MCQTKIDAHARLPVLFEFADDTSNPSDVKTSQNGLAQAGKQMKAVRRKLKMNLRKKHKAERYLRAGVMGKFKEKKKKVKIEAGCEETPPSWWPIAAQRIHLGQQSQRQHLPGAQGGCHER
jgi:hypothetical protein